MRAPRFWSAATPGFAARLLSPLGSLYGAITARRMARPGANGGLPVICVGNLVAGGAGKTPTARAIAHVLRDRFGRRPFILSRGYGGALAGPLRVLPDRHGPGDVGDEPLLLARGHPVIVARDRLAGARLAIAQGADCLVMDDGLQNPALTKTLRLAVIDGAYGIGNGLCLPAGPLRAPLAAQWPFVDAVIIIGPGEAGDRLEAAAREAGKPVLRAALQPDPACAARLAGRRVLALCGIGRPEKFSTTLREAGARIIQSRDFPDHHPYRAADVEAVLGEARVAGLTIATTQKDWVKLDRIWPGTARDQVIVLPVNLVFTDPNAIGDLLAPALAGGEF